MSADVRSLEALREWLAAVKVYREELADTVGGINMEVRRAFDWVAEQGSHWARAVRQCEEEVVQAKAELAARKFPNWDGRMPDTTVQEKNLRRAQAQLEHAGKQVLVCKSWLGRLPKLVEETYTGKGHKLQNFVDGDLLRGIASLERRLQSLERYAGERTDYSSAPSALPPTTTGDAT